MIVLDWSAHIPETLADLQQAACDGEDGLVADISLEAQRVGATDSDIEEAIASGRQMAAGTIPASYSGLARVIDADPDRRCATQRGGTGNSRCE